MKKLTIGEVAAQAGVSKSTISRYLNNNFAKMSDETRLKIEKVITELDYRPNLHAQTLKTKKSGLLGFVVADMSNLYSAKLISGASRIAREKNYQLLIMDSNNDLAIERESIKKMTDQSVEGIIVQPVSKNSQQYAGCIVPIVMADRMTLPSEFSSVVINNFDAAHAIGKHIVEREYQKIVMISEPVDYSWVREMRYQGIKSIADQFKLDFELIEFEAFESNDWPKLMTQKLKAYTSGQQKIAIFTGNSKVMMATLQVMEEMKIDIPDQIGVSGVDDWNWTGLIRPPMTSIEQSGTQVGIESVKLLTKMIDGQSSKVENVIVPAKINIRNSI